MPENKLIPNPPQKIIRKLFILISYPFILLIRIYQYVISPAIGPKCRFTPSCSQYSIEALKKHGLLKGGWLSVKRVSRCRPGGGHGYDPVDPPTP